MGQAMSPQDRRLFALPDASEVDPDFDLYDRAEAAQIARDLLVVKGGKYAERPVEPDAIVVLADWLLYGSDEWEDVDPEADPLPWPGNGMTREAFERLRVTVHPFISDGPCTCGDCK